jgi:hypothetical protein
MINVLSYRPWHNIKNVKIYLNDCIIVVTDDGIDNIDIYLFSMTLIVTTQDL